MVCLNSPATSLFIALLLAFGHSGLFAQEPPEDAGTLERRIPELSESTPRSRDHRSELRAIQLRDTSIGMLSSDGDPFLGVPAEHSSIAEIHRFEMLRPAAEGTWRTSHTHNPNGEFSLVRSSDAVQVSIGDAPSQTVTAHETLEIACNEAQPVRIASDAGKIIYSGKLRCGDAIFVNLGAAQ